MTRQAIPSPETLRRLGHELRTPLNALIGYADAMRREVFGPLPAPYGSHAAIIHAAGLHLLALVEATTAAASGETGEAAAIVEETGALLAPRAAAAGLSMTASIDPIAGGWPVDRLSFAQVLINLLDNAIKYTPVGGKIAVALEGGTERPTLIVENRGGNGASGASPGEGIGLELVREICEASGWRLRLERIPAAGMRATLALFPQAEV